MLEVRPLRSARELRAFLGFPWEVYRGDPFWVPPIYSERRQALDPRRGAFFQRGGQAQCFAAWRDGRLIGTLCAAEDGDTNQRRGLRDCVIGFFECLPDPEAARALFGAAADWARLRGLETLYGPFNLDYEDGYGVLIEGRDRPPALLCGHSPIYYQHLFETNGFLPARGDNLAFELDLNPSPALERLARAAEIARKQGKVRVRNADFKRWEVEAEIVQRLINAALRHLPDYLPWTLEMVKELLSPFRQVADPELVLFAEVNGEAVGFLPGIPDLNEVIGYANGLRWPWDYLSLLYHLRQPRRRLTVKSVLVLPEHWGSAVSILLIWTPCCSAPARRATLAWTSRSPRTTTPTRLSWPRSWAR